MRKHATLLGLSQHLEREIKGRQMALEQAVDEAADLLFRDGYRNLSGTTSQAELDAQGNPHGRGFTNPRGRRRLPVKGLPINVQDGQLRDSWVKVRTRKGRIVLGFRNPPDYAKYQLSDDGTRLMRARGFRNDMTKRFKAVRLAIRRSYTRKTK